MLAPSSAEKNAQADAERHELQRRQLTVLPAPVITEFTGLFGAVCRRDLVNRDAVCRMIADLSARFLTYADVC
jgi:hypothetical protein